MIYLKLARLFYRLLLRLFLAKNCILRVGKYSLVWAADFVFTGLNIGVKIKDGYMLSNVELGCLFSDWFVAG